MRSLKWYKSLFQTKERLREGFFTVEGVRAVDQIIQKFSHHVDELLLDETKFSQYVNFKGQIRLLTTAQFSSISSSQAPQGILAVVKIPDGYTDSSLPENPGSRILLLEHIQDPGNTGTLIRTAAALGYNGVILSDLCADPFSPKTVQSTAGSILSVWIRKTALYPELVKNLQSKGYMLCAAELNGVEHINFCKYPHHIIALGNEGSGLTKELLDMANVRFRIPFDSSKAESLNVAVSGGIAMFAAGTNTGW